MPQVTKLITESLASATPTSVHLELAAVVTMNETGANFSVADILDTGAYYIDTDIYTRVPDHQTAPRCW